jgi:N-acetyl-gamma-glutamyl-phosphate reductase
MNLKQTQADKRSRASVGIIGGSGYTAGELLRILAGHSEVAVDFVVSATHQGKLVSEVHTDLLASYPDLRFTDRLSQVDVLFLCVPHGAAQSFVKTNEIDMKTLVIDLSADHRLAGQQDYIYGLPERNREAIKGAKRIANPGCFATAIELALLPLAAQGLITSEVHITGITGTTGAGISPNATSHFSWRASNVAVYKAFSHQHLAEIGETLSYGSDVSSLLNFVPMRGPFSRGILISLYLESALTEVQARGMYQEFYDDQPFTQVALHNPDLKNVVGTNQCFVHVEKHGKYLHIVSVIDNLIKGASGQAVQNMNLALGYDECVGLNLRAIAY